MARSYNYTCHSHLDKTDILSLLPVRIHKKVKLVFLLRKGKKKLTSRWFNKFSHVGAGLHVPAQLCQVFLFHKRQLPSTAWQGWACSAPDSTGDCGQEAAGERDL